MSSTVPWLRPEERAALADFVGWVRRRFGERVREVVLFGSRARGEGHELSDLDVLVAVDDLHWVEAREVAARTGDLLNEHLVLISALALATDDMARLRDRERLIASEIARDGVPL